MILTGKSSISVMLNGGLYMAEKTRTTFKEALAQNDFLDLVPDRSEGSISSPTPGQPPSSEPAISRVQTDAQAGASLMPDRIQKWQDGTLNSHKQFLESDSEYTRLFGQITRKELELLSNNSSQAPLEQINTALKTLDSSMAMFHQHQADTLRVHEQFLDDQTQLIKDLMQVQKIPQGLPVFPQARKSLESQPSASPLPGSVADRSTGYEFNSVRSEVAPDPEPLVGAAPAIDLEILTLALLEIVSEKTGYPTEMLEMGMDMEADLGIDSIKRVEILGAMQARFPELPKADTAVLSEMRTLGQIVDQMVASPSLAREPEPASLSAEYSVMDGATVNLATAGVDVEAVKQALLEIVSEKTGYPTEMLDPAMDMEADLGIDSIKRVEILGALQTRFPELPKVEAGTLAELHTLNQITIYLTSAAPAVEKDEAPVPLLQAELAVEQPNNRSSGSGDWLPRGVVALKFLPSPDHLDMVFPKDHTCILMDGGTDLTPALATALSGQGFKVVVLGLTHALVGSQKPLPLNIHHVQMEDLTETGIQNTLATLQQEFGPAGMYIHLDPPGNAEQVFSEKEETISRTAFLVAKYLMKNLTETAQCNYAAFVTVTHMDGEFGLTTSGYFEPVSGSLFGLVKTLNLEWDKVFCRAIDLSPDVNIATAVEHIMAELYDPNRLISEVGYSSKGRFTLVVEQPGLEFN
jgi:acyl carrier protein